MEYLSLYNEMQKHRHDVKPGLTGLAQVNVRNLINWDDKFKYDIARHKDNIPNSQYCGKTGRCIIDLYCYNKQVQFIRK